MGNPDCPGCQALMERLDVLSVRLAKVEEQLTQKAPSLLADKIDYAK